MTVVLVGAVGFLIGLVAQDLAIQSLDPKAQFRPLVGVCPRCTHRRGWHHLVCQECGRSVSREPIFALVVASTAVAFQNTLGLDWLLVPYLGFLLLTSALVVTDLEDFRIVDRLNIWGTVILTIGIVAVGLLSGSASDVGRGLAGAVAYFAGASLLFIVGRGRGFGAGDVKLSFQLGLFTAYLSWTTLGRAVFVTAIVGGVLALGMVIFGSAGRKTELPYGPPMVIGAWTAIVLAGIGAGAIGP